MEKNVKCIIPLLNINKKLSLSKNLESCRIVNLYDKFVELKFNCSVRNMYYFVNLAECNNTFFKAEYKDAYLYLYFLIPKKYYWLVTISEKDCLLLAKNVLNTSLDYWTSETL